MEKIDALTLVGSYFGEVDLDRVLSSLGYSGRPKVKKGDNNVTIEFKDNGLDITLAPERALDVRARNYPDGALVVTSVLFHGTSDGGYSPYEHEPPFQVLFGMTQKDVASVLGAPSSTNASATLQRWDRVGHCASVRFSSSAAAEMIGCQLPNRFTHK